MQDLNDMRYFAEVVERGSFSAASRALGLPKSRLSRRIAGLESRLGVRLMQRTTRRLALTDSGLRLREDGRRWWANLGLLQRLWVIVLG